MPLYPAWAINVQDEGTPIGVAQTLNFVGTPVTATFGSGVATVTVTGAGSSPTLGTATLNFGAWPGASDASVAVTGQTGIGAGARVICWVAPVATTEHSADEHMADPPAVVAGNVSAGVGFTIYGMSHPPSVGPSRYGFGYPISVMNPDSSQRLDVQPVARIYGQWTVWWLWF